jgi:hypothetical protein
MSPRDISAYLRVTSAPAFGERLLAVLGKSRAA